MSTFLPIRPAMDDVTTSEVGSEYIMAVRRVVLCAHCGRAGVAAAGGVVHKFQDLGESLDIVDGCQIDSDEECSPLNEEAN